ncbi:MAG: hypothetical protein VYB46_08615 [Pseudomonadota bacterium]|nr:hypothetical protein [Pseudomonadota bacterium]
MNAPIDQIPLALLRGLAVRLPSPMPATAFVDLAEYVAGKREDAGDAAAVNAAEEVLAATAPARAGQPWTEAELRQVRDLLAQGQTAVQVAEALGRPVAATRTAIARHKLSSARSAAKPAAKPAPAVVRQPRKQRVDAWTEDRIARLKVLKATGASLEDMAQDLGRTAEACRAQLKLLRDAGEDIPGYHKSWSADEDAAIQKARDDGQPYKAIGEQLGRSAVSVEQRLRKLRPKPVSAAAGDAPEAVEPVAPEADTPAPQPKADTKPSASKPAAQPPVAAKDRKRHLLQAAIADKLPARQISCLSHLLTLSSDFTPSDDLYLAESLVARRLMAEMEDQLGCRAADITARWRSMMCSAIADQHGRATLDGQTDLLHTLRWIVDREAQQNG